MRFMLHDARFREKQENPSTSFGASGRSAMRGLDIEQLRTFTAICDYGGLSAAAPHLCLSTSAVSEQMAKLEQRLGQSLLTRGKTGATPTAHGRRLLRHARDLLALSEAAVRDLTEAPLEGEVCLALTDYFRPASVTELLQRLRLDYPGLRLNVMVAKSAWIEANEPSPEFDIGLSMRLAGTRASAAGEATLLRRERLYWTGAERSAGRERPLPVLALPAGCALQAFTIRTLERHRVPYRLAHSASGVAGLQLAISAGLGVACLNDSSIGPGMVRLNAAAGLPALQEVEFHLLPARRGEAPLVHKVRETLRELFR
jgi:DNA-binding transcriptional LysR family regulator